MAAGMISLILTPSILLFSPLPSLPLSLLHSPLSQRKLTCCELSYGEAHWAINWYPRPEVSKDLRPPNIHVRAWKSRSSPSETLRWLNLSWQCSHSLCETLRERHLVKFHSDFWSTETELISVILSHCVVKHLVIHQ